MPTKRPQSNCGVSCLQGLTSVAKLYVHSYSLLMAFFVYLRKTNIFDNVVYMMEKYADNLEDIVSERTAQLVEEKKKTDALLDRILPR